MAKSNKEHVVGQRLCLHKLNKNSKKVWASLGPCQNKGITLVALMVTVIVLLIITTAGISTSLDRFEINNYRKMKNDLELLEDKVSDYYLKYEGLPVLRQGELTSASQSTQDSNTSGDIEKNTSEPVEFKYIEYLNKLTNTNQEPATNANDNDIYYIIDLEALGNITLNYGKDFEKYKSNNVVQNVDTDIYIINEESHTIYYVKGIKMDNVTYHYIKRDEQISDDVPPTAPEIKIVDGNKIDNTEYYKPDVNIEITSGKDKWSGYSKIMYSITKNNEAIVNEQEYTKNIELYKSGKYTIEAYSLDNQQNKSAKKTFELNIKNDVKIGDFIEYDVAYKEWFTNNEYNSINGWRILNIEFNEDENSTYSNLQLISTGMPCNLNYSVIPSDESSKSWWVKNEEKQNEFLNYVNVKKENLKNQYNDTEYYSIEATAGLYFNLQNIEFLYSNDTLNKAGENKGQYYWIKNANKEYNSKTTSLVSGKNLFIARTDAKLRTITPRDAYNIAKINSKIITSTTKIDTSNSYMTDDLGLFDLFKIKNISKMEKYEYREGNEYLFGYPTSSRNILALYLRTNEKSSLSDRPNLYITGGVYVLYLRPVITISNPNVELEYQKTEDGFKYWKIVN